MCLLVALCWVLWFVVFVLIAVVVLSCFVIEYADLLLVGYCLVVLLGWLVLCVWFDLVTLFV